MGGLVSTDTSTNTSNNTNNKSQPVTNKKHSSSLEQKINQYAADLILRSNFRDMQSLMKKEECDKLVILTSKVIDQHFHKADINMFNSKLNDGNDSVFSEPIEYIKETKLQRETENMQKEKTKLCQGLARYYIKIAHLFAAITQTVNPTYIYDVAEPKNKYVTRYQPSTYLPSYSPSKKDDKQYGGLYTDYLQGSDSVSRTRSPGQTKQKLKLKWDELRELNNYEYTKFVKTELNGFCNKRLDVLDPSGILQAPDEHEALFQIKPEICKSNESYKNLERVVGIPDLSELYKDEYDPETKQYSEMSDKMKAQYQEDLENFYKAFTGRKFMPNNIRKFSDIELIDYSKLKGCNKSSSQFPVDYSFVGGTIYKNNEGELYFLSKDNLVNLKLDKITVNTKWHDNSIFTVVTQNNFGKEGSKIQLWGTFNNNGETFEISFINQSYGMFNRGQTGTLKMKLFNDYATKIKDMMITTQENKDKLLKILELVFSKTIVEGYEVVGISDKLTEHELDELITKARGIIINMYLSCEKDFKEALQIFDAIIDKQILEESISIGEQLEHRMNEYVASDPIDLEREIIEIDEMNKQEEQTDKDSDTESNEVEVTEEKSQ